MGIKCSLLGHSFTGTQVEEEREEQGSEVVVTIKEVETCERCGAERVVSENKEVTALETGGDAPGADDAVAGGASHGTGMGTDTGPAAGTGTSPTPDMDAVEDDAELIGEDDADAEPEREREPEPEPTADADADVDPDPGPATGTHPEVDAPPSDPPAEDPSPAEDDGVILDAEDDDPGRQPGEWPEEADSGPEERDASSGASDVAWPDDGRDDDGDAWEPAESLTRKIDDAEVEPVGSATVTVPEGSFECPECGFRTSVESTSLRAGDFCPECHRGSLEHHPDDETRKE